MNQSEFQANVCNRCKARENVRERETLIVFGFSSDWLKKWREFYQVNQSQSAAKQTQTKRGITFNTQLETALL